MKWIAFLTFVVALIIAIPVVYVVFGQQIYGKITSPRLSRLTYKETRYDRESMCFFVCRYYPKYNYSATGSQKEIVNKIIKDMEKRGAELRRNQENNGYAIGCYGRVGDRYQFRYKNAQPADYFSDFRVTFYADKKPGDTGSNEIGCGRTDRTYRVEVDDNLENYWLGFQ